MIKRVWTASCIAVIAASCMQAAPWVKGYVVAFYDPAFRYGGRADYSRGTEIEPGVDCLHGSTIHFAVPAHVEKTFSPQARQRARQVIDDIRTSFGERVRKLDWMSDSTKAQALDKLAKMNAKVGYPDAWRNYSKLTVSEGPFVSNVPSSATVGIGTS